MLRNARAPLTAVARRLSSPLTPIRAASTASVSLEPSSSSRRILRQASKIWKGKGKEKSSNRGGEGESRPKRLLKPYELSQRLAQMCEEGKLDEAVETLKNMPLDAQNTSTWNSMISYAGRVGRYQLAYQLYIEMKRRGFKPVLRTYTTLMSVFTKVPSWEGRSKLIENVHKAYDNYLSYIELVKEHNPESPEYSVAPTNAYLTILGRIGEHQRMFDVYNSLDSSGSLSPSHVTYTMMFRALAQRSTAASGDEAQERATRERHASDARLIWRQLLKRVEDGAPIAIDSFLIGALIRVLALGRPADQIAAFDVLREYVGLAKPGETAPVATVELSAPLFSDVLSLCNAAKKHRLTVHFAQQLMAKNPSLLDRGHMDHVLAAYGALAATGSANEAARALQTLEWMVEQEMTAGKEGRRIHPGLSTYTLAFVACWRAKDWESTMRVFELMSGYRSQDFADGAKGVPQAVRAARRNIMPDAAAASCIARTAIATGDAAAMRQCLRIAQRLSFARYLSAGEAEAVEVKTQPRKSSPYHAYKLASALVEAVDTVVPKRTEDSPRLGPEERTFVAIRSAARGFLIANRHQRPSANDTPLLEEELLGSEEGLSAMDEAIEWERISREYKNSSRTH